MSAQPTAGTAAAGPATGVPGPAPAPWRWAQDHPRLVDAGLAVVVLAVATPGLDSRGRGDGGSDAVTLGTLVVAAAALVLRRRNPLAVWAVAGVAAVLHGEGGTALAVPALVALGTVGDREPLTTTVLTTALTCAGFALARTPVDGPLVEGRGDSPVLSVLALSGSAAAVGVAVRSSRAALEAARARARQAELTREEEAERRVTGERLRIARELHDVVAHHISVVNVQAGVARHLVDGHPDQARSALGLVREANRTALSELSAVVGLLRSADGSAPAEPAPGLDRLDALLESARRTGLRLTATTRGAPAPLVVEHRPQAVVIEVGNPVAAGVAGRRARADRHARAGGGRVRDADRRPLPGRHPHGAGVHPEGAGVTVRVLPADDQVLIRSGSAARLHLSPLTGTTHGKRAMSELRVGDRAQLVVLTHRTGLVHAGDPGRRP
ncbi:sensor histidine kinase [Geodermatophilus maliterrae]|uniref:histidine kinase n=1 Tax=Geodermatophilus maliterrae TaxID=3162531 RepID=A0ABV3XIP0_9ACTN